MPADTVGPPSTIAPPGRWLLRLTVLLVAPILLAWVPAPTVRAAGPVIDLSRAVARSSGRALTRGRFLLTSVREEHDPTWLWATRSLIDPGWRAPNGDAAGALNTLAQMREAEAYAWEVAVDLAGYGDGIRTRSMPAINTDGVTGPSGGLMLALAFTDTLNRGDLTGGRKIAGTGTIDWSGAVGEIGYVTYKVQGAATAGATVFFVPWGNLAEARRAAPRSMQVVPVASFEEALGWLCRSGPDDGACPKLAARPAA